MNLLLWLLAGYLAVIGTLIAFALYRPVKAKETPSTPHPCRHRYVVLERYEDGQKKVSCERCGNVTLIAPSFRRPWR